MFCDNALGGFLTTTYSLTLTDAALTAARSLANSNPDFAGKYLRVYLSGKGCDGFDYGVTFDVTQAGDRTFDCSDDIKLVCDERSLQFVDGSSIDWVDDERGRGFLVNNPNHKKFRGKFYKKEAWRQKLESSLSETQ